MKLWVYDVCWAAACAFAAYYEYEAILYLPGIFGSYLAWSASVCITFTLVFRIRRWAAR